MISGSPRRRPAGFTLIELLVASLLTVLLMSAVFTVLQSGLAETRRLAAEDARLPPVWLMTEQIRRDLQNAQGLQILSNGVRMFGYVATNPGDRLPTLKRAFVSYQIQPAGGRSALYRLEQPVSDSIPEAARMELMWWGVGRLEVIPLAAEVDSEDAIDQVPADTGGLPDVPSSLQIAIYDDQQRLLERSTVHHHQDR